MPTPFSDLTGSPYDNATLGANLAKQTADFVISISAGVITAKPAVGSGLSVYTGTDAFTVIQSAITALSVGKGGSIYISNGQYFLTNELTITGWDTSRPTSSQLVIQGNGSSTVIIQNTSGKNGIVVKNQVSIVFRDFSMYAGSGAKSGILLDDSGSVSEVSVWGGTIDNIFIQSNSTSQPAFYAKNFFDLEVPHLTALNDSNHGIILENTSLTVNYGNSNFGFVRTTAKLTTPYAGLYIKSSNSNGSKSINLCTFQNYECSIAYRGIWSTSMWQMTFVLVDIEGLPQPIYLDGSTTLGFSRWNNFLSGYLLPQGAGAVGITTTLYTGGNKFSLYVEDDTAIPPFIDSQMYAPVNSFDITCGGLGVPNITIATPLTTPVLIKTTPGTVINNLPAGTTVATKPPGDSTASPASTNFVTSAISVSVTKRIAYWEAQGNNTAINQLGLGLNIQGTATIRNVALTNSYTRLRRLGFVGGSGVNSTGGLIGNGQFNQVEGFSVRLVFSIQQYNSGHSYVAGIGNSYTSSVQPSTLVQSLKMYADVGDTNFKIMGAGNTLGTAINLGANFPSNTSATDVYDVTFTLLAGGTTATYLVKRIGTAFTASGNIAIVPNSFNLLAPWCVASNHASGISASLDIARVSVTTDN